MILKKMINFYDLMNNVTKINLSMNIHTTECPKTMNS